MAEDTRIEKARASLAKMERQIEDLQEEVERKRDQISEARFEHLQKSIDEVNEKLFSLAAEINEPDPPHTVQF